MKSTQAFSQLERLAGTLKQTHLKRLFETDEDRFDRFHLQNDHILYDFSKQKITPEVLQALLNLATESNLASWMDKLFSGEKINHTENRAAWHTALREINTPSSDVAQQWQKMEKIVDLMHAHQFRGFSGSAITHVINIGVGGSDLGPLMVTYALEADKLPNAPEVHFVSTLDARQLQRLLKRLNPATTLFIVASKSFTTIDTLSLADTARAWVEASSPTAKAAMRHFIGISTDPLKMREWGILPQLQLEFWDWVGGRYSLWSSIGLSIAFKLGMQGFKALLSGAHAMDIHFKTEPFDQNIPVLLGLVGIWNTNFLDLKAQAILPYDSRLKYFASYLEQLEMESNGKSTRRDGTATQYRTCPVLWGEIGPNAQHAFYQLLHQGTERVMSDFILFTQGQSNSERAKYHQNLNIANCLAQSRAMMIGQTSADLNKNYPGDQVSNTLLLKQLDAFHLGYLIALYEHKVFVQSVIWDINPFDQWGVELGKKLAMDILGNIERQSTESLDSSTAGILNTLWKQNNEN